MVCEYFAVKQINVTMPFIELSCDGTQLCLAMYRQIRALWKVLSQQAISIFVRTAFAFNFPKDITPISR
jgi:hypothetical protein